MVVKIHSFIPSFIVLQLHSFQGCRWGRWEAGTPWRVFQSITVPHRDKQPFILILSIYGTINVILFGFGLLEKNFLQRVHPVQNILPWLLKTYIKNRYFFSLLKQLKTYWSKFSEGKTHHNFWNSLSLSLFFFIQAVQMKVIMLTPPLWENV